MRTVCTICGAPERARGLCNAHYHRLKNERKPKNPCGCGCGGLTRFSFLHGHHTRLFTSEEQARRGRMNNGDAMRDTGGADWYRKVKGRHEHRRVAEAMLGRPLRGVPPA